MTCIFADSKVGPLDPLTAPNADFIAIFSLPRSCKINVKEFLSPSSFFAHLLTAGFEYSDPLASVFILSLTSPLGP